MTVKKILEKARSQIGIVESPKNSNNVKYNTEYYGGVVRGTNYAWCCTFIWWLFKSCGASSLFYNGEKTAYCPTVESYYRRKKQWYYKGQAGDLVLFDFGNKGYAEHIGIVESVNANGTYNTIEGNTGTNNNANGGAVMRRIRYKSQIRGFARPNYKKEVEEMKELTSVNDIVWELHYRGIITDKELWLEKMEADKNVYWLARKLTNYIIEKGV